ncbi:tetratricopeptide repeat protein [Parendozoicomonas haliclonae]|nr:hypothetical protein [Parendozoicomonas haliclonae]
MPNGEHAPRPHTDLQQRSTEPCSPDQTTAHEEPLNVVMSQCTQWLTSKQSQKVLDRLAAYNPPGLTELEKCRIATVRLVALFCTPQIERQELNRQLQSFAMQALTLLLTGDEEQAKAIEGYCVMVSAQFSHMPDLNKESDNKGVCELIKGMTCWDCNKANALRHFRASCAAGHPGGQYLVGRFCLRDEQTQEAQQYFQKALQQGFEPAREFHTYCLANQARDQIHQYKHPGDTESVTKAIELTREAALAGDPHCLALLGMAYSQGGNGLKQSFALGTCYNEQALAYGSVAAKVVRAIQLTGWSKENSTAEEINRYSCNLRPLEVARMYKDIRIALEAEHQRLKATQLPFLKAMNLPPVPSSLLSITRSFHESLNSVDSRSITPAGRTIYARGRLCHDLMMLMGIPESGQEEQARKRMLAQDQADAIYWVGVTYAFGIGVSVDKARARQLFNQALAKDYGPAAVMLGYFAREEAAQDPAAQARQNWYHDRAIAMQVDGAACELMHCRLQDGFPADGYLTFRELPRTYKDANESFEHYNIGRCTQQETTGRLVTLGDEGSTRARLLLCRKSIEQNKNRNARKCLSTEPQLITPEALLLQQYLNDQKDLRLEQPEEQINTACAFRALDLITNLSCTLQDISTDRLVSLLVSQATERECLSLRQEPGIAGVCALLVQMAVSSKNPNEQLLLTRCCYWLSGEKEHGQALVQCLKSQGMNSELAHIERRLHNENTTQTDEDQWHEMPLVSELYRQQLISAIESVGAHEISLTIKRTPLGRLSQSVHIPDRLGLSSGQLGLCYGNKARHSGASCLSKTACNPDQLSRQLNDIDIPVKNCTLPTAKLQKHQQNLAVMIHNFCSSASNRAEHPELCGRIYYLMGLCCHHLNLPDAAGDYFAMATEQNHDDAFLPAAIYAWARSDAVSFQIWLLRAPESEDKQRWVQEREMAAIRHTLLEDQQHIPLTKESLNQAKELMRMGDHHAISELILQALISTDPRDTGQAKLRAFIHEALCCALATGSLSILPMAATIMMDLIRLNLTAPLALLQAMKSIKPCKPEPPQGDKKRMQRLFASGPEHTGLSTFQKTLNVIENHGPENNTDVHVLTAVLCDLGFIHDEAIVARYSNGRSGQYRMNQGLRKCMTEFVKGNYQEVQKIFLGNLPIPIDAGGLLFCQMQVFCGTEKHSTLPATLKKMAAKGMTTANTCLAALSLSKGNTDRARHHLAPLKEAATPDPDGLCLLAFLTPTEPGLLKRAASFCSAPAIVHQAMEAIRRNKPEKARALLTAPWIKNNPEARSMIAYLDKVTHAEAVAAAGQSPLAIFRLITLKLSLNDNDQLNLGKLISKLADSKNPDEWHFLQAHPDLSLLLNHLDILELEEGFQTSNSPLSKAAGKLRQRLQGKVNGANGSGADTHKALPAELAKAKLDSWLSAPITAQTEKSIQKLMKICPDLKTSEHCRQVTEQLIKNNAQQCETAFRWLEQSTTADHLPALLIQALGTALEQQPIQTTWALQLLTTLKQHDQLHGLETEQLATIINLLLVQRPLDCSLILELEQLHSRGAPSCLAQQPVSKLLLLLDQSQSQHTTTGKQDQAAVSLTDRLIQTIEERKEDVLSGSSAITASQQMRQFYLHSKPADYTKALEWITAGHAQPNACEKVLTAELEAALIPPLDQEWIGLVVEQLKTSLKAQSKTAMSFQSKTFQLTLQSAMNAAVDAGQMELLQVLVRFMSIKQLPVPSVLKSATCFHISQMILTKDDQKTKVVKAIMVPALQTEGCALPLVIEVIQDLTSHNPALPEAFLHPFLNMIDEAGLKRPLLRMLPAQTARALGQKLLEENETSLWLDLLNQDIPEHCLQGLSTDTLCILYNNNEDGKGIRKQANSIILNALQQRCSTQMVSLPADILLDILDQVLEQASFSLPALAINICRTMAQQIPENIPDILEKLKGQRSSMAATLLPALDQLMTELQTLYEVAGQNPEEIIDELFRDSHSLFIDMGAIRTQAELEQTNYRVLLNRLNFWMRKCDDFNLKDKRTDIIQQTRQLTQMAQSVSLFAMVDQWHEAEEGQEKLELSRQLIRKFSDRDRVDSQPGLSGSDRNTLDEMWDYPAQFAKQLQTLYRDKSIRYGSDEWASATQLLQSTPNSHHQHAALSSHLSEIYSKHIRRKINECEQKLNSVNTKDLGNLVDPKDIDEQIKGLVKAQESKRTGESLQFKISTRVTRLEEHYEDSLKAYAFKQQVFELQMMTATERHNLPLQKLEEHKQALRLHHTQHPDVGIDDALLKVVYQQEQILDYEILRRRFYKSHKPSDEYSINPQETLWLYQELQPLLFNDLAQEWLQLPQIRREAEQFIAQLTDDLEQKPTMNADERLQACEQLHQLTIQLSDNSEDRVLAFAEFYQRQGRQDKADIHWGRLAGSSNEEIRAKIPPMIARQSRINRLSERLIRLEPGAALSEEIHQLVRDLSGEQDQAIKPLLDRYYRLNAAHDKTTLERQPTPVKARPVSRPQSSDLSLTQTRSERASHRREKKRKDKQPAKHLLSFTYESHEPKERPLPSQRLGLTPQSTDDRSRPARLNSNGSHPTTQQTWAQHLTPESRGNPIDNAIATLTAFNSNPDLRAHMQRLMQIDPYILGDAGRQQRQQLAELLEFTVAYIAQQYSCPELLQKLLDCAGAVNHSEERASSRFAPLFKKDERRYE